MIVSKWTAVEVKALRDAVRLTQERFAESIGYTVHAVRKWENLPVGRSIGRQSAEDMDRRLELLTPAQRERFRTALELAYSSSLTAIGGEPLFTEVDLDVNRRQFGLLACTALAGPTLTSDTNLPQIGLGDADRLANVVDQIEQQASRVGGAPLVRPVLYRLEQTKQLLDTASFESSAAAAAFTTAAGHLAATAGWLTFDATMYPESKRCVAESLALGNLSDDDDVTIHACMAASLRTLGLVKTGEGSPQQALRLMARARTLLRGKPPGRIHAAVATREAQAFAHLRDRQGFSRAISTAWREMDEATGHEPIDSCPVWLRYLTKSEVRYHEARGYTRLGDTNRAVELFEAMERDAAGRNAVFYRAGKAATLASGGDITGAINEGLPVLADLADGMSSPRTVKILEPIRNAARDLPAATEFRDRYDELTRSVGI
ncbi:helix-turn-helix domain-containing protein [Nocardia tengchongensis]